MKATCHPSHKLPNKSVLWWMDQNQQPQPWNTDITRVCHCSAQNVLSCLYLAYFYIKTLLITSHLRMHNEWFRNTQFENAGDDISVCVKLSSWPANRVNYRELGLEPQSWLCTWLLRQPGGHTEQVMRLSWGWAESTAVLFHFLLKCFKEIDLLTNILSFWDFPGFIKVISNFY